MCQVFALYTNMERAAKMGFRPLEYALQLSDIFDKKIFVNADLIRPVRSAEEIVRNYNAGYMSALKYVEEGAVYEGKIENLKLFYDKGVRMSTLTWNYVNDLAYPNPPAAENGGRIIYRYDREHGLTNIGKEFVQAMEEMGIVIDLSHLNDCGGGWRILYCKSRYAGYSQPFECKRTVRHSAQSERQHDTSYRGARRCGRN